MEPRFCLGSASTAIANKPLLTATLFGEPMPKTIGVSSIGLSTFEILKTDTCCNATLTTNNRLDFASKAEISEAPSPPTLMVDLY